MNILSLMPSGVDVFVVGENRSGVRSAEPMLVVGRVQHRRADHQNVAGRIQPRRTGWGWGTLAANGLEGEVFASNVFSEVKGRFDMIISNPPFHDGMQTSLDAAQTLIRGAVRHLNSGGELRIVANAFLPYPKILDETFGFHEVIAQTGRFKVYRTVMTRQAKK